MVPGGVSYGMKTFGTNYCTVVPDYNTATYTVRDRYRDEYNEMHERKMMKLREMMRYMDYPTFAVDSYYTPAEPVQRKEPVAQKVDKYKDKIRKLFWHRYMQTGVLPFRPQELPS